MAIFLGQITLFALDYAPVGFAMCNGQLLNCTQYSALYSLIGTTYGGNGVKTFALPDLRGRVAKGAVGGQGLGWASGSEMVMLDKNSLGSHSHTIQGTTQIADRRDPNSSAFAVYPDDTANFYAPPDPPVPLADLSIGGSGGADLPHPNMQPYVALNYCIAVAGLFPTRGSARSAQTGIAA